MAAGFLKKRNEMFGKNKMIFKSKGNFINVTVLTFLMVLINIGLLPLAAAAQVRIMPLGDSITGTPGCWRAILWNQLQNSGYTDIDFVGTQTGQTCSLPFDSDCEGHGGILAIDIADQNQLPSWLNATNPDILMMHLGTNDILSGTKTVDMILSAYSTMVGQMRVNNPYMKILVAQIIPVYTATTQCTTCYQQVIDLNVAIPAWAAGLATSQSPIVVVDQWTGFDTTIDTSEGIHPNDTGNQKIADKWYPALVAYLNGSVSTTTSMAGGSSNGDVNENGTIDIVDALLIAQYYVGLDPANFNPGLADVNCSGIRDIIDALLIARYYVGLISSFPC